MRNVIDCINAFIPLLSTEYELVLGRKGVAVTLRILFDKKDCFHLMGLQYLVDRPELSRDRGKVFDEIADGTIAIEKIESSGPVSRFSTKQNEKFCQLSCWQRRYPLKQLPRFFAHSTCVRSGCSLR